MSHVPIETIEEDAADLQFPKGKPKQSSMVVLQVTANPFIHSRIDFDSGSVADERLPFIRLRNDESFNTKADITRCDICGCSLVEPYITCAQCPPKQKRPGHWSCLKCFASGAETATHTSSHNYIITHDNIKLFPNSNWSASEERRLLELMQHHGFGNWGDIARALQTKTANECRDHYSDNYIGGIFAKTCGLAKHSYRRTVVPYLYKSNSIDPPRHTMEMIHSKLMAGYRFARGDFDTPYDVSAESLVSRLHSPRDWGKEYEEIGAELNAALFVAYNNRLR